jgi:hypothetical protein
MQSDISLIAILKDWLIPLGSVFLSIWFASSAKKDAERAQSLLSQIDNTIQTWQSQIMNSAVNIIDSLPQVIEGKTELSKMKAIEDLVDVMRENATNPKGSADNHSRTMQALSSQISSLSALLARKQ